MWTHLKASTTFPIGPASVLYYPNSSIPTMTSTTNLNDNLVKIDNLITGLNFLMEELETRKKEYTEQGNIQNLVNQRVEHILTYDDSHLRKISRRVVNDKWYELLNEMTMRLQGPLEAILKEQISIAVEKELHRLGIEAKSTQN